MCVGYPSQAGWISMRLSPSVTVHVDRYDDSDLPAKLAIPLRVIASNVAIACQLDAHIPVKALATALIPGFAEEAA